MPRRGVGFISSEQLQELEGRSGRSSAASDETKLEE